ncbi:transcription antitermination factor NusB [candidate division WWE3 bacterium RBG_19FT_COMBO_34_6]|uniref:Transcription antitermination protein NusB n=1 Tax=candidate division WWE3 bacterium RBG_19FT_COMBO_34_6 TaxID=1802612 RepID=A0A1F4UN92_UNCKA|nr:MAG: transcription antitermination factor NusB [candidate division WWE3 bacterium RBG_19FT_COMBO_34_6]
MKSKTDPRHAARKLALSSIFCWLFSDPLEQETVELSKELLQENECDLDLAYRIVNGVKNYKREIDELIQQCAKDWPLEKISKIDLVVLRIAIFEILYDGGKVPDKVAIDEAVELAKEFGNDTSSKFVNGVLGTVVDIKREVTQNG